MQLKSILVGAALGAAAGLAQASECGEQIRLLDDRYSLRVMQPDGQATPAAEQTAASGSGGAASSSAGLDTVPNTGGIANPRNTPIAPLDADRRERMREALVTARRADHAGDGTTCAAKVAEARRLVQGATEPRPK